VGKINRLFICAIFLVSFSGLAFGQTVVLKSGKRVSGRIVEQTDKFIKVEFQGAVLTFYNDEISGIEQPLAEGQKIVTPQMGPLYQSYIQSLSVPVGAKIEPAGTKETLAEPEKPASLTSKTAEYVPPNLDNGDGTSTFNYQALLDRIREQRNPSKSPVKSEREEKSE